MRREQMFKRILVVTAALAMATTVYAQTPMPLARAVVSDEVAGRTLMKMQINATVARQLVDACLDFAKTQPNGPGTYAIFALRRPATSTTRPSLAELCPSASGPGR